MWVFSWKGLCPLVVHTWCIKSKVRWILIVGTYRPSTFTNLVGYNNKVSVVNDRKIIIVTLDLGNNGYQGVTFLVTGIKTDKKIRVLLTSDFIFSCVNEKQNFLFLKLDTKVLRSVSIVIVRSLSFLLYLLSCESRCISV